MLKYIYFLFLLSFSVLCLGQNEIIDSLHNVSKKQNGVELIKSYHQLTIEYIKNEDFLNAREFNKKATLLLKEFPDSSQYIFVNNYKGVIYLKTNELDSAIQVYTSLIKYIDENPDYIKYTIGCLGNRSLCYEQKDLTHKALEDLVQALEVAKKYDQKKYMGILYGSLAMNFHGQEQYEKAIEYHFEAIEIKRDLKNQHSLAITYQNLALSFSRINKYNRAFEYFEKGRVIFEEVNDKVGIALSNHYTSNTYLQLYNQNFDSKVNENIDNKSFLDSAYTLNRKAYDQLKAIDNLFYINEVQIEYANILFAEKKYNNAEKVLTNLLIDLKNKYNSKESSVTKKLYEVSKIKNNYLKALKFHERYLKIEDSLKNKNTLKEIGKKQAELEFNKEQELANLKFKNEIKNLNFKNEKEQIIEENNKKKQQYVIITFSLAIIIILFFFLFVFRRWKITNTQKETINKQKEQIEKEQKATEDSINYAKNIQKAAFPTNELIHNLFDESFIYFNPKDIVSGDFYWASKINNKKIIALADCTGHGVPGAFMTLISLNILNQIIAEEIDTPQDILQQLHLRLQKRLSSSSKGATKYGLDIALCIVDGDKLSFCGTHNSLYLVRNSKLTEYKSDKFQLGSNNQTVFNVSQISIQKNDLFYLFTDGFPDQKGGIKGKKYYYGKFRELITSTSKLPINDQQIELDNKFNEWKGLNEQLDDVSIIGFKI